MLSRRALLVSLAAAAVRPPASSAQTAAAPDSGETTTPRTVLRLQRRTIEVNGKSASVFDIRQPDGTDGIITDVEKPFRVRVENNIDQQSLIHWHGLTPPWRQDGVPGISGPPIPPFERRLSAAKPLESRKADRVHTLNLTGEMAGYIWSINNVAWNRNVPSLPIAKGERVELAMINQTRMPHPMHLHGHEFQVVEIDGQRLGGAVRDTVLVPPGRRVVVAFNANNPGLWAFHCHLLYHLDAGMFTTLRYV
jgi:FtsP/CotA-like multicopper oxidase with cupredoxin domain